MSLPTTSLSNVPIQQPPLQTNGYFSPAWVHFFQFLFDRVGGSNAPSNSQIATAISTGGGPAIPVTPGSSPYVYTAPAIGAVVVSGGGLQNVEISRDGATYYTVGTFRGMFPMTTGDKLRVTYSSSPLMTFIPR